MEQAVSRALRENLERVQKTSEDLHHAISDLVAACASTRATSALPPMLRAQTAAASLTATLEVLSKFITVALQSSPRPPVEAEVTHVVSLPMPTGEPAPEPERPISPLPTPMAQGSASAGYEEVAVDESLPTLEEAPESPAGVPLTTVPEAFEVSRLPTDEQELHRRANRVAKVSMQDIKMLRPEQVRLGREKKDLCIRLRDDIEKAHREYDRRFQTILHHPVDYFYHWMVQILADGDPQALGEYPYATPARRA